MDLGSLLNNTLIKNEEVNLASGKIGDDTTEKELNHAGIKGKTLKKDSSIVITFDSDIDLTSAKVKWYNAAAAVDCTTAAACSAACAVCTAACAAVAAATVIFSSVSTGIAA